MVARRQDSPPRFVEIHYTLHVHTDEPQRRVDLAHRNLRNYGTVYNTLAAVCDVHGEMLALPAADLASAEPGFAEPRSVAGGYSIDQDMAAVTAENAAGGTGGPR